MDDVRHLLKSIRKDIAELTKRVSAIETRIVKIGVDIGNLNMRHAGLDIHLDEIHRLIEKGD